MNISRIKYLKRELENEEIDLTEIAEIDHAYFELKESGVELRDDPDNALAADMLDELEENRPLMEKRLYEWVRVTFSEEDAMEPYWDIEDMANYINQTQVIFGAEEGTLAHILGEK